MIFKICQYIFTIKVLSPLDKDMALHLNKLETALPKNTLCQLSLVEIGTVVLEEKMKM